MRRSSLALWLGVPAISATRLLLHRRALFEAIHAEQSDRRGRPPAPGTVRCSVVVPAYEEGPRIADTVRRIRRDLAEIGANGGLEIIVVDDGSSDGTATEARAAGADVVVEHGTNRGKGAAVRSGVLAAHGRTVAFTDADLAYAPDQLVNLLTEVEDGWDVVVGSRRHTETTTLVRARRIREIGGRVINVLTHAVLLGQYRDTQCGIKAFRSDVAHILFSHARLDGFAFDVELFHLVERYRLSLAEVPVVVTNSSSSSVRVLRDGFRLVRDLLRVGAWARQGVYRLHPTEQARLDARAG